MYGVRYLGYSYTNCAWYAFPYEALEVFTIALLNVASADFLKKNAPYGTLATLTGIAGGAHHGFGKGVGGLAGGIIIEVTKSTKMAFYYFSMISFGAGTVYGVFAHLTFYVKNRNARSRANTNEQTNSKARDSDNDDDEVERAEPFLPEEGEQHQMNAITALRETKED